MEFFVSRRLFALVFSTGFSASAAVTLAIAAQFGTDGRVPVPDRLAAVTKKIGTLETPELGAFCTAFCVSENTIATASHCLHGVPGGAHIDPRRVTFKLGSAGPHDASALLAGTARDVRTQRRSILAGTTHLDISPPISADRDWAITGLAEPVCRQGGLAILPDPAPAPDQHGEKSRAVYQIAMHRDLPDTNLRLASDCTDQDALTLEQKKTVPHDFARPEAILFHNCDTGGGSSGSPMLIDGDNGPEVIGINVGTYIVTRRIVTSGENSETLLSEPVANTAVLSSEFASAARAFAASHYPRFKSSSTRALSASVSVPPAAAPGTPAARER